MDLRSEILKELVISASIFKINIIRIEFRENINYLRKTLLIDYEFEGEKFGFKHEYSYEYSYEYPKIAKYIVGNFVDRVINGSEDMMREYYGQEYKLREQIYK